MNTFSLPKTQHLVVFQEVIRSGSIGAGAKALGLTQPAVSKIIGDMESYFGSELIVRRKYPASRSPRPGRYFSTGQKRSPVK
ncbi:DNA-binding transcriptional activator TdcA [Klebsiella pneumoniae]|uniref:DNA-binding transcriptional activator TdcA n=1 Tax=Klebsiella pneumoniae TaxID=573 RepID=A0A378B002_KLEPN|nr:DNA-binding transcriptional activator TdcA [Klebsiella pneumoniae]